MSFTAKDARAMEPAAAPVINAEVTFNLGADRQLRLLTHFPQHGGDSVLDAMFRSADRQKARYEIETWEKDLAVHEKTLAQFEEDLARLDRDFERDQAERQRKIEGADAEHKKVFDAAYDAHQAAGRRGEFQPSGQTASRLRAIAADRHKAAEEIEKAKSERETAIGNLGVSIKRYKDEIAKCRAEIAKRQALLAGAANAA